MRFQTCCLSIEGCWAVCRSAAAVCLDGPGLSVCRYVCMRAKCLHTDRFLPQLKNVELSVGSCSIESWRTKIVSSGWSGPQFRHSVMHRRFIVAWIVQCACPLFIWNCTPLNPWTVCSSGDVKGPYAVWDWDAAKTLKVYGHLAMMHL